MLNAARAIKAEIRRLQKNERKLPYVGYSVILDTYQGSKHQIWMFENGYVWETETTTGYLSKHHDISLTGEFVYLKKNFDIKNKMLIDKSGQSSAVCRLHLDVLLL